MQLIVRMAAAGTASAVLACLPHAGALASEGALAPLATDGGTATETVLDFRPRIGAPRGPSSRPHVHLHLYRQPLTDTPGCQRQPLEERRVGLVLSGGVSKGLAFVGALQALDEIGIRVDRVAGTSMGAVIGAFYAAGYPPDHLFNRFLEASPGTEQRAADVFGRIDWRTMFTDVPRVRSLTFNQLTSWGLGEGQGALPRTYQLGLRSGQNLTAELGKYLMAASAVSEGCFHDLYVPFVASATSVTTAETRRLTQGDLAVAVRASLSYPLLFTPTFIDGERFIDGGMLDNFPVRAFTEEIDELTKTLPRPKAATDAAPSGYSVLLGFDVSDTRVSPLPDSSIFQAASLKDAYSAVEAGIGASISRETRRSATDLDTCDFLAPPRSGGKPCLFRVKLDRPGGFTDFGDAQIADFVHAGRAMVLWKLCEALGRPPPDSWCAQGLGDLAEGRLNWSSLTTPEKTAHSTRMLTLGRWIREVLCQPDPRHRACAGPWSHLLHEANATLNSARGLTALHGSFRTRAADLRGEIARVLAGGEVRAQPELPAQAWPATLEGVDLRWERGQVRLSVSPTLRKNLGQRDALLKAAAAQLVWLEHQLSRPPGQDPDEPMISLDGSEVSRVTVGLSEHALRVRVTGWTYRVGGLVRKRGLTEQRGLIDARLDYWGLPEAARRKHLMGVQQCHGVAPEQKGAAPGCHPMAAHQPWMKAQGGGVDDSWHVALDSREPPRAAPPSPGPWWNQIWRHLKEQSEAEDEGLDVRYGRWAAARCQGKPCKPSLGAELEILLERYHAVASVEHIRLEGIKPGLLEIGEKPTHRSPRGGLFFGYQYDYRNKHSFGMRYVYETQHDSRWKPTRVLLGLAANEPLSEQVGARLLDAKFLFLPSVDALVPDYSLNPYAARRVHRIGDGRSLLSWAERGITATVSGRAPTRSEQWLGGNDELALSWALSANRRWLDTAQGSPLEAWRQRLQDPSIGLERQARTSLVLTQRATQFWGEATLQYPVSVALHRAKGRDFSEIVGDFRIEVPQVLWHENQMVAARVFASRIKPLKGGAGGPPVPHEELYSAGGQYPFTERAAWGRKRFDYLGADLNELWGSRAYGLEGRASVWRVDGLSYFAPYARLQVDAVLQTLKIGFPQDPARRTRNAYGLVTSAYIPSLGSLRPRFSLAAGREFGGPMRLFASMDVLI